MNVAWETIGVYLKVKLEEAKAEADKANEEKTLAEARWSKAHRLWSNLDGLVRLWNDTFGEPGEEIPL